MNFNGLTAAQVIANRQKYGTNEMPRPKLKSAWQFFKEVFQDKLNIILLVMMCMFIVLSALDYGSVYEAAGIGIVLLVVVITTVASKLKGQRSAEELRLKSSLLYADVVRDGATIRIPSVDVVVDDIVILHAGEMVCADGVVVDGAIAVNNAILNGFCVRVNGFKIFHRLRTNPMFLAVAFGVVLCTVLCVSFGGAVLQLSPLDTYQWLIVFALSLMIVPINFIRLLFI